MTSYSNTLSMSTVHMYLYAINFRPLSYYTTVILYSLTCYIFTRTPLISDRTSHNRNQNL